MELTKTQREFIENTICSIDTETAYLDMLNECYEPVQICGYSYQQGDALKSIDPIAFRCGEVDYISSQVDDGTWVEINGDFYWVSDVEDHIQD
jgi:hypothetical protein